MRKFAFVRGYEGQINLPARKTKKSAGYDIEAADRILIWPGETVLVPTGLKAYMADDEALFLYLRSSAGIKRGLRMANEVAVIDSDYADNPDNEGHIHIAVWNPAPGPTIVIEKGERIAQGVFTKFLTTDDDAAEGERVGGIGSTGV